MPPFLRQLPIANADEPCTVGSGDCRYRKTRVGRSSSTGDVVFNGDHRDSAAGDTPVHADFELKQMPLKMNNYPARFITDATAVDTD